MGKRRLLSREFKQEAVRLVRERGVAMTQVALSPLTSNGKCK